MLSVFHYLHYYVSLLIPHPWLNETIWAKHEFFWVLMNVLSAPWRLSAFLRFWVFKDERAKPPLPAKRVLESHAYVFHFLGFSLNVHALAYLSLLVSMHGISA